MWYVKLYLVRPGEPQVEVSCQKFEKIDSAQRTFRSLVKGLHPGFEVSIGLSGK